MSTSGSNQLPGTPGGSSSLGMSSSSSTSQSQSSSSVPMSSTSSCPNLVSDFESAYSEMLSTLTQEDELVQDKKRRTESMQQQEEEKIVKFMALARQLETFFLQKRLLIHSHRPEAILREDSSELKSELLKKDELVRAHYDKLTQWQAMLQDMQQQGGSPGGGGERGEQKAAPAAAAAAAAAGAAAATAAGMSVPGGPMPARLPLPLGARAGAPMQPGVGAPQGGFVPGNNYRMMSQQHQN